MTIKNYDYHSTEHSKTQEIIFTLITAHATLCQILHHLAGQNQAGYGGDKGCAARNIPAVGAVAFGAGRADTVRPEADGHVLILFLDKMVITILSCESFAGRR